MKQVSYRLFTTPAWYAMWRPVGVKYGSIMDKAKAAGYDVVESEGIWESTPMFGKGWIGVVVSSDDASLKKVEGEFNVKEVKGPYSDLADAFKELMKEGQFEESYTVYLNSPNDVSKEELLTHIVYKMK